MSAAPQLDQLPEVAFCDAWRDMPESEKNAMNPELRARCIRRFNTESPSAGSALRFDRPEPGVPRGRAEKEGRALRPTNPALPRVWLDMARLPESWPQFIKRLVWSRSLLLVYGPPASGKTTFLIDMLVHIALSRAWRRRLTHLGLWVYVAAEAGNSILMRFVAARDALVGEAHEGRIPLAIVTRAVNLMLPVEVEGLIEELRLIANEAGMSLAGVAFDTLSRSIPGGDENGFDMTRAVGVADRIRDELGAAVAFVHHSGKDGTKGARGHTSLTAAADTIIRIDNGVATVEKVRDGVAGETFPFDLEVVELGLDEDGDRITTCVVRHLDTAATPTAPPAPVLSGVAKVALQALREAIDAQGEELPPTSAIPYAVRAVKIDRWREQFRLRYGAEERDAEAVRKAFQRAREALLKAEAIGIAVPYAWAARSAP